MKHLGTRYVENKEKTVHTLELGYSELLMLYQVMKWAYQRIPKLTEVQTARSRLRSMIGSLDKVVMESHKKEFDLVKKAQSILGTNY